MSWFGFDNKRVLDKPHVKFTIVLPGHPEREKDKRKDYVERIGRAVARQGWRVTAMQIVHPGDDKPVPFFSDVAARLDELIDEAQGLRELVLSEPEPETPQEYYEAAELFHTMDLERVVEDLEATLDKMRRDTEANLDAEEALA